MLIACVQRTIQELFEVYSPMDDAGFPVKAEEFVVLSQEPSVSETIAPKIARPFIEVRRNMVNRKTCLTMISLSLDYVCFQSMVVWFRSPGL